MVCKHAYHFRHHVCIWARGTRQVKAKTYHQQDLRGREVETSCDWNGVYRGAHRVCTWFFFHDDYTVPVIYAQHHSTPGIGGCSLLSSNERRFMPVAAAPAAPLAAPQQPTPPASGALMLHLAHRALTGQELDAARNCVAASQHTRLTLLPNHALNPDGELEGFVFECCADDPASVLPLTRSSFATTAVYECMPDASAFVDMTSNAARCAAELLEVVRGLEADEAEPLRFDSFYLVVCGCPGNRCFCFSNPPILQGKGGRGSGPSSRGAGEQHTADARPVRLLMRDPLTCMYMCMCDINLHLRTALT
jgi:hypothetical protein